MALKDWKIVSTWKDYHKSITWGRYKDKYSFVMVWKTGLPLKEMMRRGMHGTFIFQARIGKTKNFPKKYFKTKATAMTYAYSFMRSH